MSYPYEDLTGQKFNLLTVVERSKNKKPNKVLWVCQSDCGNITETDSWSLKNNRTKSCGCLKRKIKDLRGQHFGKLTVVDINTDSKYQTRPGHNSSYWLCRCQCGNYTTVRADKLKDGTTQSCGCTKSFMEEKIATILKELNLNYETEYVFSDLFGDSNQLRFDFAIFDKLNNTLLCLIEYQGEQHYRKEFYDNDGDFEKRQKYDEKKRKYCKEKGIKLIEIPYTDKLKISSQYILDLIERTIEV